MSLNDWIFNNLSPDGQYFRDGDCFENWAPGEKGMYSNVAFGLLGLIIEKVSDTPFNVYCKENIFEPLGMDNTGWFLHEIDTTRYIRPYGYITEENRDFMMMQRHMLPNETDFKPGTYVEICLYSFPNYPDGLVRTSLSDLSLYLRAILNGGTLYGNRILEEVTLQMMLSPQVTENSSMGLCWHSAEMDLDGNKRTLWGHTGGDPGITTFVFFDPIEKVGVITFQNHDSGGTDEVVKKLFTTALDR